MHFYQSMTAKLMTSVLVLSTMMTPAFATEMDTVAARTGTNAFTTLMEGTSVLSTMTEDTQEKTQTDVAEPSDNTSSEVSSNNVTASVASDPLQVFDEELYGQVASGPLNIRSGPGTEYASVGLLSTGEIVELEGQVGGMGGWYKIAEGYVSTDYVAQVDLDSISAQGSSMAQYALQYVGYPYLYGGASPSGFDCSGFVTYICKQFGYSVNRTASSQMSNGVAVSKDQLQPGDLVFFNNGNSSKLATHVGIYIGNNQFVHSSTPTVGVIVSSMNEAYYGSGYVGARRLG